MTFDTSRTLSNEQIAERTDIWTLIVGTAALGANSPTLRCLVAVPNDVTNARYVVYQWAKDYGIVPRRLPTPPDTPFKLAWCIRDAGNDPAELLKAMAGMIRG